MRSQEIETDVTIVGGGLAGVCAAVSAARQGGRVALVNNRPVLGGNGSSEIRVWVSGATAHGMQRWARENGIIGEILLENQYRNPDGNPVYFDDVILDLVRAEPNIRLFLNTDVRDVAAHGPDDARVIDSVTGWTMGSEVLTTFRSPLFADCTGDGLVGALAGAEFRLGREARTEFGEELAPDTADDELLGSTLLLYAKDAGHPVPFVAPDSAKDITTTPIPSSRVIHAADSGCFYWWIEWGGELDIAADNERIRDELRSVVLGVWDYIKNSGNYDADNLTLEWIGNIPGKREYRRFVGDYTLTQQDVLSQRDFPDGVGFGGWGIDLHPVQGMYSAGSGALQRNPPGIYPIPYRCLYSANVTNMFMAGRDVSATHVAFASTRVMATCSTLGEAVGVAAAMCVEKGVLPRDIATDRLNELRQRLLRADAPILGVRNEDPCDLARTATVSASSWRRVVASGAASGANLPLTNDVGIVVPVDPSIDAVGLLVSATTAATLRVEAWSTGRPQNAVPVRAEAAAEVVVEAGEAPQWVRVPLVWSPSEPANAVLVVKAVRGVELAMTSDVPPGVLALLHGAPTLDQNVQIAADDLVITWPAGPLRGRCPVFSIADESRAYAPQLAVGGYQRPYGGPQLWCSAPFVEDEVPTLVLSWREPVEIGEIDLVFDDDLDVELNSLHHHRTPWPVAPTLVRDYLLEYEDEHGSWCRADTVTNNRRRRVRHRFAESVRASGLRLRVTSSNGAPDVRLVSLRAYSTVGE